MTDYLCTTVAEHYYRSTAADIEALLNDTARLSRLSRGKYAHIGQDIITLRDISRSSAENG